MAEEAVGFPTKATPLGPGDPVEVSGPVHTSGGTFAERKAAREAAQAGDDAKVVESGDAEDKAVAKKSASKK